MTVNELLKQKLAELGAVLWRLRDHRQIGLREMARKLDISPSYLQALERGRQRPSAAVALRWLKELRVDDNLRQDCYALWSRKARDEWENWNKVLLG